MLNKENQKLHRSTIFRHLDGIGTGPTALILQQHEVLDYLISNKTVLLSELTEKFKANEGYLNVALRILSSQGWLNHSIDNKKNKVSYSINGKTEIASDLIYLYQEAVDIMGFYQTLNQDTFHKAPFAEMEIAFQNYLDLLQSDNRSDIFRQILAHIEGILLGPVIVFLGMSGMFHKYFMEANFKPEEFHKDPSNFKKVLDMFKHVGWFIEKNGTYKFTDEGLFFAKRASAYGVTVSYLPMFMNLNELIFGNPKAIRDTKAGEQEKHVNREMNVWGSGGAHSAYFKVVDEIIIEIFNQPISKQPKGVLDMGCGNGAFIQHLFDVIEKHTLRGKMLDEYPLILVGSDYNEAALKITKANLIQADIWAKVIWGDIGKPDLLAKELQENYDIDLKDLLNVRTFLDHNRIFSQPDTLTENRASDSTGAFAFRGSRISNNVIEDSLLEHFKKWAPYIKKFGLLVIELHTVPPNITAQNIGSTAATAYDATHGYSDQYIVEVDVFDKIIKEAGLTANDKLCRKFPDTDYATVTINLLHGNTSPVI
ncbi:MAG: class I SAM-dependent methyltransferase [Balneola sp.]